MSGTAVADSATGPAAAVGTDRTKGRRPTVAATPGTVPTATPPRRDRLLVVAALLLVAGAADAGPTLAPARDRSSVAAPRAQPTAVPPAPLLGRLDAPIGALTALAFAPDGSLLAAAARTSGAVTLWESASARELRTVHGPSTADRGAHRRPRESSRRMTA